MPLFNFCAVCDDVRLELQNKASFIGFYGALPHVEINVQDPSAPIIKLAFVLLSLSPVPAGKYRVRLSVKAPAGQELLAGNDVLTAEATGAPLNVIIYTIPLALAGAGTYRVTVIVDDKEDFVGTLRISQAPMP